MSKKINIAIACILSAFLLLPCVPSLTAHANSAQTYWRGRDSFGSYVTDENCPVVVEGEILTLNIVSLPNSYYTSLEDFESYYATVTAEYTFRNPADYDVDMTLVFPFGARPDYFYNSIYDEEKGEYVTFDDTARYAITADGEELERNIRYTLDSWEFDPAVDIARLSSQKRTYGFITPETPVTAYTYEFNAENSSHSTCVAANFYGLADSNKTSVLLQECNLGEYGSKKEICGTWLSRNNVFTMYVIGEPLQKMPEWKMYENGSLKKEVAGEAKLSTKLPPTTITFNEFALSYYNSEEGVSEVDYYNAVLDILIESMEDGKLVTRNTYNSLNVSNNLMRWYEYNLSIPAGGSVVNSVTAPLYPGIDLDWEPAKYSYTYLLSPASTWADFGSFEVRIYTCYYLVEGSLSFETHEAGPYEEIENFYKYTQNGLPEGELTFTLATEKSPQRRRQSIGTNIAYFMTFFGIPIIFALVAVGIIVAAVLITVHIVRKKKRNKMQQK